MLDCNSNQPSLNFKYPYWEGEKLIILWENKWFDVRCFSSSSTSSHDLALWFLLRLDLLDRLQRELPRRVELQKLLEELSHVIIVFRRRLDVLAFPHLLKWKMDCPIVHVQLNYPKLGWKGGFFPQNSKNIRFILGQCCLCRKQASICPSPGAPLPFSWRPASCSSPRRTCCPRASRESRSSHPSPVKLDLYVTSEYV